MSTSVLAKEFDRLATRNAQLLHTDEGEGDSLGQSAELSEEFTTNLDRLEEIKGLMQKADRLDAVVAWSKTPERRAAAFTQEPGQVERQEQEQSKLSAGQSLVQNADFKAWLEHVAPGGKISESTPINSQKFQIQNALVTGGSATSGGAFFETDYTGQYAPFIQPMLTVRDLVLNQNTDADVVEYVRANVHANAAAETGEAADALDGEITFDDPDYVVATPSGTKPEGSFTWAKVTSTVQPIAEGVPVTRRALMNGSQLAGIIDDQLRYDLAQRLNTQMISGDGSEPNIRGIRNTVGITTQAFSSNVIETLRKAKTKVSSPLTGSGKIPNGAVLTPTSMETLDLFRVGGSTTTDGQFLLNPYTDRPQRLWGMSLVEEPGMTADKAVVGYFRDAILWDRQQATVQAYEQHKDFAARNLVYLLAEWWGTFGVLQPKSFCDATMTSG